MRQAVTKNYAEANALEVVAGTQQFAKGVPQERFRKLKLASLNTSFEPMAFTSNKT